MGVSYFQLSYSKEGNEFQLERDAKSTAIYKLNFLTESAYIRELVLKKYEHKLYAFSSMDNLAETETMPPISIEFIDPKDILADLQVYKFALADIRSEISSPSDPLLAKEIIDWKLNDDTLNWIEDEMKELCEVCNKALENNYYIKYGCYC